jgi:glycosyltransferase involved in cell wall biosynthesis
MSGLDLLVLPSAWGEAFPNILGEAMASGVPCVATDTGDAQWIIGDQHRVVPPGDIAAMQAAIGDLLGLSGEARRALGLAGRARVIEEFSLPAVARSYEALYDLVMYRWQRRKRDGTTIDAAEAL